MARMGEIPVDRFAPILDRLLKHYTIRQISELCDVPERRLHDIKHRKAANIQMETADKILIGMDRNDLWQSELADLYIEEAV